MAPQFYRVAALIAVAVLAGCGGGAGDDRTLIDRIASSSNVAPNEFAVLPQKPLVLPDDLTALPEPVPGATSRADLTPNADALRALSGQDGRAAPIGSDNALLATVGAGQARPDIRAVLAAEDAAYREDNRGLPLDRLLGRVTERDIYEDELLDPEAELRRLRAQGVWVPQLPAEQ
ncbi:DUF3035 domain-containing protein [Halovulum dunhuangense]|uniref:DUF3035 domain-containing protein n=1 Tax=Halovulum dunhuangense TaxID=1505036 RepID=A0A849L090_9RHOB|nr:DUF3035 domain-containing protein [Halovulum dunhuangense]NNU79580.1 DUF3035 domain-containing protein [Halovulum dunhuangense]